MATVNVIKAVSRSRGGKGAARAERRAGRVPGIIYGDGKPPLPISLDYNELRQRIFAGKFLGENPDLRLRDIPDTPGGLLACPGAFTSFHVLPRKIIPVRSIPGHVLRHLTHRKMVC